MESRRKPQLLVYLTLFSVLFSQTLAWPLFEAPSLSDRASFEGEKELDEALLTVGTDMLLRALAENSRNARNAEEVLTRDYKRLRGQLLAKRHTESFMGKRHSTNVSEDNGKIKRHSDGIFTDQYSRYLKRKALKEYLRKVLGNRCRKQNKPPES